MQHLNLTVTSTSGPTEKFMAVIYDTRDDYERTLNLYTSFSLIQDGA